MDAAPLELTGAEKRAGPTRTMSKNRFIGPLEATRIVVVMGMMNKGIGSGGHVAFDRIEGTLERWEGTFCVGHSSVMRRGKPGQSLTVVPDSGTDAPVNLSGSMTIDIINREHFFALESVL